MLKAIKAGFVMILGGLLGEIGAALIILSELTAIKITGGLFGISGIFVFIYGIVLLYKDLFSMIFGCIRKR